MLISISRHDEPITAVIARVGGGWKRCNSRPRVNETAKGIESKGNRGL